MAPAFTDRAAETLERLLGVKAEAVDEPTPKGARSVRAHAGGTTYIVTRRQTEARAMLEAEVLAALRTHGLDVPEVMAHEGRWLVQSDLGPDRLSPRLRQCDEADGKSLLQAGLDSLEAAQVAGDVLRLPHRLFAIGSPAGWLDRLIAAPAGLSDYLGIDAPAFDEEALKAVLERAPRSFVKWDARPANAAIRPQGSVAWFDWEHCGRRNRIDDMIWLTADETVPDWETSEEALIADNLQRFDEGGYPRGAEAYLRAFGSFHMLVRLTVIVKNRLRRETWSFNRETGPVGRLPRSAARLCRRGARWAAQCRESAPMAPWYLSVQRAMGLGTEQP